MSVPKIRSRISSDYDPVSKVYGYWQGDGNSVKHLFVQWPSLRSHSLINDVLGTPKALRAKPCVHESARFVGRPLQSYVADHGYAITWHDDYPPKLPFGGDLFSNSMLAVPHSARVQAAGRAFTSFSERFPELISGAEFTQGIIELKALLPKIEKTVTRTIASGYLNKKFGWDNLISDLNVLSTSLRSIRERMEFLKRTYGKPTKLFHRENSFHSVNSTTWQEDKERGFGLRYTLRSYRADFIAGASLLQTMDHIDDFVGWLRAIVISLGLNNPLKAAWQTTRLSFVVDWFFDVSAHLERLAAVQPAERWDIFNVTSTVVWNARIDVTQVNHDFQGGVPNQEFYLGYLDCKRYERLIGLPVDLNVFTPSTCTPDQLVLMLAMAGSK